MKGEGEEGEVVEWRFPMPPDFDSVGEGYTGVKMAAVDKQIGLREWAMDSSSEKCTPIFQLWNEIKL